MTKIRSDHKTSRNQQIYQEYISTDTSYNKLAKKHGLTPQRINKIVNDIKEMGLGETLSDKDSKEKREKFKNKAIELREQGKVALALDMFEQILEWDRNNNNINGQMDVLGHKKIALTLKVDTAKTIEEKLESLKLAEKTIMEAIKLGKKESIDAGRIAIQEIHMGTILLQQSETENSTKTETATQAIKYLETAMKNLAGSPAHKAWPSRALGLAYYYSGNTEKALKTLFDAEKLLVQGYQDEISAGDQGRIKIKVWASGIQMALAQIMYKEKKLFLAEMYAAAVAGTPDPDNILATRKKEAKELLAKIEE